jgi:hypothetical protein
MLMIRLQGRKAERALREESTEAPDSPGSTTNK